MAAPGSQRVKIKLRPRSRRDVVQTGAEAEDAARHGVAFGGRVFAYRGRVVPERTPSCGIMMKAGAGSSLAGGSPMKFSFSSSA